HFQPCCFGLNFSLLIQAFPPFVKTALPVAFQRPFNARLLKNSLKVKGAIPSAFGFRSTCAPSAGAGYAPRGVCPATRFGLQRVAALVAAPATGPKPLPLL